ncbi:LysM peptidoglycan-binding domain-containing protein, partial [Ottowia sp.]|uniref:LysM peptidoglycan-binding domain-containing protein n=1 Tax=Ottowia sp. TaxID=1898956 RepID=UPI0039E53A1A
MGFPDASPTRVPATPQRPPPPPEPPPREEVDPAVRQPALHAGKADAPPPERYVQHEVERGETVTEVAKRYQTTVPMIAAANPQVGDLDQIDIGQKLNVPIGQGYGEEPTQAVVEKGQTLTEMAKSYQLPLNVVVAANRHSLPNPNLIHPGQVVQMPLDKPNTALEDRVRATDQAMADLQRAEQERADASPSTSSQVDRLDQRVADAKETLRTATKAELDERARLSTPPGRSPDEVAYAAAGDAIKARYAASPAETARLDEALKSLKVTRDADAIVQAAKLGDTPGKQVESLNNSLKDASPEVRQAVLQSADGKAIVQNAADWAMEPLEGGDAQKAWDRAQKEGGYMPHWSGAQAMDRLDQVTRNLDPELAAQVTSAAIPTFERYASSYNEKFGTDPLVGPGTASMLKVLDRSLDTPAGRSNLERLASLGVGDFRGIYEHISQGGNPAYGVALAQSGKVNQDMLLANVYAGVEAQRERIAETAQAYSEHYEELGWLVSNHGGSMTPEQLQKAIEDYTKEKGPEWEQKGKELQDKLAAQGAELQTQLTELGKLPADTYGRDKAIADALNDPVVGLAMNTAWEKNPALLQGAKGDSMLAFLADPTVKGSARLTDIGRRFTSGMAMAWMKSNTGAALAKFDPTDPASVQAAHRALESLRNGQLVKVLGVSTGEMDKAIEAMKKAMPEASDTTEQITAKLAKLDDELGTIGQAIKGRYGFDPSTANEGQVAFSRATVAGQLLRGVGVMLGGVGLLASTKTAIDDPSLKTWMKVASDAAGLTQRGLELGVGVFKWDQGTSLAAKAGTKAGSFLAGRLLGAASSVFDIWSGVEALQKGDYASAGLYGAGAAGTLMASLFTGPVGWAGLIIMGVSAAGLWAWNNVKEANKHEPDSDGGTSMRFLQHAGLNESTARALTDQSGDGFSTLPMFARYAQLKGYDLQNADDQKVFVDWLNGMPKDELGKLRDRMHREL